MIGHEVFVRVERVDLNREDAATGDDGARHRANPIRAHRSGEHLKGLAYGLIDAETDRVQAVPGARGGQGDRVRTRLQKVDRLAKLPAVLVNEDAQTRSVDDVPGSVNHLDAHVHSVPCGHRKLVRGQSQFDVIGTARGKAEQRGVRVDVGLIQRGQRECQILRERRPQQQGRRPIGVQIPRHAHSVRQRLLVVQQAVPKLHSARVLRAFGAHLHVHRHRNDATIGIGELESDHRELGDVVADGFYGKREMIGPRVRYAKRIGERRRLPRRRHHLNSVGAWFNARRHLGRQGVGVHVLHGIQRRGRIR